MELFSQRYWGGVWIHQEVACAAQLSLHCRQKLVPVVGFLLLGYELARKFTPGEAKLEWMPLYRAVGNFQGTWLLELWYMRLVQVHHMVHRNGHHFGNHLLGLLDKTRHLGCQNPKYRVYGLMHLAEDYEYGGIEIDYGLSVAQLYCSVPRYFVSKYERYGPSGCLVFLCAVSSESLQPIHGLPSWCPDWSSGKKATVIMDTRSSSFIPAAGQVRCEKPWYSPDGKILHAQGFCLDTVSAMCLDSFADLVKDDFPISNTFSSWLATLGSFDNQHFVEADIAHVSLQLLRTLTAGYGFEGAEEAWAELIELGTNPMTAEKSLTDIRSLVTCDFMDLWTSLSMAGEDGLLFKGNTGSVGLIPKETLFEDQEWILLDCPVPVVLRPVDDYFTVVGVAYVDGFMHGESCSAMPPVVEKGDKYGEFEIATIKLK